MRNEINNKQGLISSLILPDFIVGLLK
jgi:hypothetical protein